MSDKSPPKVWKVRLQYDTGSSSSSRWEWFEDFDEMFERVIVWAIEAEAHRRNQPHRSAAQLWRRFEAWWRRDDDADTERRYPTIYKVAIFQQGDEGWIEWKPVLTPPSMQLEAAS